VTTADNAPESDILPAGPTPPAPEDSGPETAADSEREIQRRLTQQGRENADLRRQIVAANQAAQAQQAKMSELETGYRLLTANLSERDRRDAAARQQQIEAELASLPPADRLEKKIELLQGQITHLQTAAQPRPVQAQPAAAPQPATPTVPSPSDQERADYMERRVREIAQEAQAEFGVAVDLDAIPDQDWDSEETFYRSVMKQAAQASRTGGTTVAPRKQAAETPAQMRDRIRAEEREKLGVNSPASPRATPAARKKAPDEGDIRAAVQSYDSKLGPKANLAKLKELRQSLG
jgi:hypothetical protein